VTPRGRFLTAIRRGTPDRAPRYAEFTPHLLDELRTRTGCTDPAEYFGYEMREVCFHPTQLRRDFSPYLGELPPGSTVSEWGVGEIPAHLYHLTGMVHPLRAATRVEEVVAFPWPDCSAGYRHADLETRVAEIHSRHLAAVTDWTTIFEQAWYLRGMETLMTDFYERPDMAGALLDRVTEIACGVQRRFAAAGVDLVRTGDDIGAQQGMLMSPAMWRTWLKPRLAQLIAEVKRTNPNVMVLYDSDGNFEPVIPDLIAVGIDVLAPIQPECNNVEFLKREYGKDLAFWGSLSVQHTLPFGTPDDVRREVQHRMQTIGADGGLVIAPSHVLPPETPWENVTALFDAIEEYGRYS
jgi:uroporphyrinogen decarboxylase